MCPRRALSDEAETARAPQVSEREIELGREIIAKTRARTHTTKQHSTTHNAFYSLYQNLYTIKNIGRLVKRHLFSTTFLFILHLS